MRRAIALILSLAPLGCGGCILDVDLTGDLDGKDIEPQFPQRDEWRAAIDAELAQDVETINIGGLEADGNFANRGDVEVRFDGEEGRILVEMRRFAFATDVEEVQPVFERLWPWAFAGERLQAPDGSMLDGDCSEVWKDDCHLRVYYDGQLQPYLAGADLRVTLPASFAGHLYVTTQDLVDDDDYPLRGDVRIDGLPGSADIAVEAGTVQVRLAEDALVAPVCGVQGNATCEEWSEGEDPAPWALACGCTDFGNLRVLGSAADVTLDVPRELWASLLVENAHTAATELWCEVEVDCDGFEDCEMLLDDEVVPGKKQAELNDPGPSALEGAGYSIRVHNDACQSVSYVDGPEDYESPAVDVRGEILVCAGCLD